VAGYDAGLIDRLVENSAHAGRVVVARTSVDAKRLAMRPIAWAAFLFQMDLAGLTGVELLAHARASHVATPALLLSSRPAAEEIEAAYDLNASYLVTPVASARIRRFVLSATTSGCVRRAVRLWEQRYGLSAAESDVLARAAEGHSQDVIAIQRGSSRLTVKKQVSNLLAKTSDESLQAAAVRLLRAAMDPSPDAYSERSIV
jgi:DNA-binding NarL/FixJ family response regulator